MSKVEYYGSYLLLTVKHGGITYDCLVSEDCKNLYECNPIPDNWVEIEDVIRDHAYKGKIINLK
jgi:hypothetical protein